MREIQAPRLHWALRRHLASATLTDINRTGRPGGFRCVPSTSALRWPAIAACNDVRERRTLEGRSALEDFVQTISKERAPRAINCDYTS
jgi:hypothetical protein